MQFGPVIWFGILAWVLFALGAVVLALALFGDRSRGRRRCRRCWYRMEGTPGFTCPECGRVATAEPELQRTRRHPWWAALGVVILLGSLASWKVPGAVRNGWPTVVPTWAMLSLAPPDPQEWLDSPGAGSRSPPLPAMLTEFVRRVQGGQIGPGAAAQWARIVEARFRAKGEFGCDGAKPDQLTLVIYDVRDLLDEAVTQNPACTRSQAADDVVSLVTSNVDFEGWRDNGGRTGRIATVGDLMFVHTEARSHGTIAALLRAVREATPASPATMGDSPAGWPALDRNLRVLRDTRVGAVPTSASLEDVVQLVGRATGIEVVLDTEELAHSRIHTGAPLSVAFEACSAAQMLDAAARKAVDDQGRIDPCGWEVEPQRVVIRSRFESHRYIILRVYAVGDLLPGETKPAWAMSDQIIQAITTAVEFDSWADNGGDVGRICRSPKKLVITATPRMHEQVEALLASLRAAGPRMGERLKELQSTPPQPE